MLIDYTFKDGITLPIRIFLQTYESMTTNEDGKEIRDYTAVYVSEVRHYPLFEDGPVEVGRLNSLEIPELIAASFRKLAEITSKEFEDNPLIGLKYKHPKGDEANA